METIATEGLGDRSYLAHDGERAIVVDPQRDVDRVLAVAASAGVAITHVLETHLHNDYVSGGLELARLTGAEYLVAAAEDVGFDRRPMRHGEQTRSGSLMVRAVGAPGHTLHHLAYVVEVEGRPRAVFTGGSLLFGTVGRTDLDARATPDALTRMQFQAVRGLVESLPDDAVVYPTHGFGSFCSAAATSGADTSTIGEERAGNLAITAVSEDAFVEAILSGLTAYPRYYAHIGPINRQGPSPIDLTPPSEVDPREVRRRIAAGEWVVDLRSRRVFAGAHVAGSISVECGDPFATYLGWVIPWRTPLTLIGPDAAAVASAQRAVARIGIDHVAGASLRSVQDLSGGVPVRGYPVADFRSLATDLADHGDIVLDVRRDDEWHAGHIAGAVHIPMHDLLDRLSEAPAGRLWVHCASGFRASIAASLLDRAGREVILVDDDWKNVESAGLAIVTTGPANR